MVGGRGIVVIIYHTPYDEHAPYNGFRGETVDISHLSLENKVNLKESNELEDRGWGRPWRCWSDVEFYHILGRNDRAFAQQPPSLMVTTSHECIILTFLAI